jgi:hypothetical protein
MVGFAVDSLGLAWVPPPPPPLRPKFGFARPSPLRFQRHHI